MKSIAFLAALAALAAPALAETFRMRDGTYHAGEVVSSDDEIVRIRFTATGLELELKWDQLAPGEAKRIRARAAMERAARFQIDGEVITMKSGKIHEGLATDNPDSVTLRTSNGPVELKKMLIEKRAKSKINATSVYTPAELYDAKKIDYDLAGASGNFDLGDLCLAISLWAKAKEHFVKALELDPTWKGRCESRIARADAGLREEEAAAMLAEAEALLKDEKYDEGLAKLEEIKTKYAGTVAASKAAEMAPKITEDADAFKSEQKKGMDTKRAKAYYDEMASLVRKVASDKKMTFAEIKEYVEKYMVGEILKKIADKEKLDVKAVEADWKARDLPDWKQASYGEGSWMMEPDTLAIENVESLEDQRNKSKNAQLIADLKKAAADQRKLVDEWWAKLNQTGKINWLTAYAAERTMIVKPAEHVPCNKCAGKGTAGATSLCLRCLGIGKDRVVQYK